MWVWILLSHRESFWRKNLYRRYFVWVWILVSHQKQRTFSEGRNYTVGITYTEGILCVSLNLAVSPGVKNVFWRKNIYRRYFVYESEFSYLTRKHEHILKEGIPKVFCVWVWIFLSHQEASTCSEGRNTEGILCMSLNLRISPGSKNMFWRKEYRRYFVYESESSYLTRKQRTFSEGRTHTEGILYMSLNFSVSLPRKNMYWN